MKDILYLNYADGHLANHLYHQIASQIESYIQEVDADTLLTFEPAGISGHLDHIALSMISNYVFRESTDLKELWLHCIRHEQAKNYSDYFIYFPQGYSREKIDKIVGVSTVWQTKIKAIKAHQSQSHDLEQILNTIESFP